MNTVFVLSYFYDVENSGNEMVCCDVYTNKFVAHLAMVKAYNEKIVELFTDGIEESESNYCNEDSAYIQNEDKAEFWQWCINEKQIIND